MIEQKDNHIFPFLWMRGEEESVIREEMAKIDECGIKAVCVEARPHDDFCGEGWWHDLDIVIDEAEKRGMRIWILDDKHFPTGYANGLIETKYQNLKKQYLNFNTVDIFGASKLMTISVERMLKPKVSVFDIGKPCDEAERARNTLEAVVACRIVSGNILDEETVDLTDQVKDGEVTFRLPEGQWRVYVVYRTRTDGGEPNYINMIDRASAAVQIEGVYESHYERYADKFGGVIAGFFSDEPQLGNVGGFSKTAKIGTEMPLLWSADLEGELKAIYGDDLHRLLPLLWNDTEQMDLAPAVRYDYTDQVSRLYSEFFSRKVGDWCRAHDVEYIGHVVEDDGAHARCGMGAGHFFRALAGQDMAGIDCIGAQVVYGAPDAQRRQFSVCDGEFYHYVLGKLGASSAHLDATKKGRLMCELFGAYGWAFGIRDQKYVLDHLLTRGVNELVPHAFSMADYPDPDCPPHYYAHGNNPQFPYFKDLMRYANAMCNVLSGGTHEAHVAVLYDAELEWVGDHMPLQKVARTLTEHQIEFDFVSIDMLRGEFGFEPVYGDGKLSINGVEFSALVVPWAERVPEVLAGTVAEHPELPVLFVDACPEQVVCSKGSAAARVDARALARLRNVSVAPLETLAGVLSERFGAGAVLEPACPDVSLYCYGTPAGEVVLLLNESAYRAYDGRAYVPSGKRYAELDPLTGKRYALRANEDGSAFALHLEPAECLVLVECAAGETLERNAKRAVLEAPATRELDLSKGWDVAAAHARAYPNFGIAEHVDALEPYSFAHPAFAGVIRYEKPFELDADMPQAVLSMEHVQELASVWVDGEPVGKAIQPPYRVVVSGGLGAGRHELAIEVTTTADRDQRNYPHAPFDLYFEASEATGLYGRVALEEKSVKEGE